MPPSPRTSGVPAGHRVSRPEGTKADYGRKSGLGVLSFALGIQRRANHGFLGSLHAKMSVCWDGLGGEPPSSSTRASSTNTSPSTTSAMRNWMGSSPGGVIRVCEPTANGPLISTGSVATTHNRFRRGRCPSRRCQNQPPSLGLSHRPVRCLYLRHSRRRTQQVRRHRRSSGRTHFERRGQASQPQRQQRPDLRLWQRPLGRRQVCLRQPCQPLPCPLPLSRLRPLPPSLPRLLPRRLQRVDQKALLLLQSPARRVFPIDRPCKCTFRPPRLGCSSLWCRLSRLSCLALE